jgi:hypothetical protein
VGWGNESKGEYFMEEQKEKCPVIIAAIAVIVVEVLMSIFCKKD